MEVAVGVGGLAAGASALRVEKTVGENMVDTAWEQPAACENLRSFHCFGFPCRRHQLSSTTM